MELLSNNQVKDLRRLKQKKFREQSGEFLLEGVRLCEEALASPLLRNCRNLQHCFTRIRVSAFRR